MDDIHARLPVLLRAASCELHGWLRVLVNFAPEPAGRKRVRNWRCVVVTTWCIMYIYIYTLDFQRP